MTKQLWKLGGVATALLSVGALTTQSVQAITVFDNRTDFRNATGTLNQEGFEETYGKTDSFDYGPLTVTESGDGSDNNRVRPDSDFPNLVQPIPTQGSDGVLIRDNPNSTGGVFKFENFDKPITAFGIDIGADKSLDLIVGSGNGTINERVNNVSSSGDATFFGFVADSGETFNTITFNVDDGESDGTIVSFDNAEFQPVPFEAETGVGLALVGAYFGWRQLRRKNKKASKQS